MTAQLTEAAEKLRDTVKRVIVRALYGRGPPADAAADDTLSALSLDWNTAAWVATNAEVVKALAESERWKPTHRPYKGGLYRVLHEVANITVARPLQPIKAVVYENFDGQIWVRPFDEFHGPRENGEPRFTPIAAQTLSPQEPKNE